MWMVPRRLPLKCAMGFLDSILKKKDKSAPDAEGEVSQDAPSPEAPKASNAKAEMAAKLKGFCIIWIRSSLASSLLRSLFCLFSKCSQQRAKLNQF